MTTKKTTRPPAGPVPTSLPVATALTDAGTQQATVVNESAGALVRGLEAMRKINERAVQSALLRYTTAAKTLSASRQPMELLSMQSELIRSEFEGTTTYWQELSGAAMEMQAELLSCSSHLIDSDAVLEAASAMNAVPDLKGWSSFFSTGQRP